MKIFRLIKYIIKYHKIIICNNPLYSFYFISFKQNIKNKRYDKLYKNYKKYFKYLILNHNDADDFVIATGKTNSIRDLCKLVFSKLNLNYEDYVKVNPKYIRPEELNYLCGDSSKSRKVLGWKPEYSFETLVDDMLEYFLKIY